MKISVNSPKSRRSVEFDNQNIGANFDEAVALVGKDAVYVGYAQDAVIGAQGAARLKLDKGFNKGENGQPVFTVEDAVNAGNSFRPGVKAIRAGGGKASKSELDQLVEKVKAHKAGTAVLPDADFKAARSRIKELLEGIV
jgi:hypothetical protein